MQNSMAILWSKRLAQAGIFAFLVIGLPACALAPRALGLFLPIAGIACLPLALLHARTAYANRPHNLQLWLLGFVLFILIGALGAPTLGATLNVIPGLLANLLCFTALLIATAFAFSRQQVLRAATAGFVIMVTFLCIEWLMGMPLNGFLAELKGKPTEPLYTLDRTIIIASLVIWPIAAYAKSCNIRRRILLSAILAICWLVFHTSSQAAAVGMVAGTLLYVGSYWLPRLSYALLRTVVIAVLLAAPLLILVVQHVLADNPNFWPAANSGERLSIWISTTASIMLEPWLGHGFDAMRRLGTDGVPRQHPHNGALQIWLETGAAGIVLASAAVYALLGKLRNFDLRLRPWMMAALASWLVVFCVGYNIWQIWWQAVTLLVIYLFMQLNRNDAHSPM